jgi:sortase A
MKTKANVEAGAPPDARNKWRVTIERFLSGLGLTLLAVYVAARMHGIVLSRALVQNFDALQTQASLEEEPSGRQSSSHVDFSLWSDKRIEAYKQSLAQHFDQPLAVLRVAKIGLEVPVLDGTDDLTLNRGVGRIVGTARPGEPGNIAIAGHRDGFFRGLKDLRMGDTIDLVMRDQTDTYVVDETQIVNPDNVSVLRSTTTPSLTLVTCYPFYFIGSAPQRFIVHASLVDSVPPSNSVPNLRISLVHKKNRQEITNET